MGPEDLRKLVGNGPVTKHSMQVGVAYSGVCVRDMSLVKSCSKAEKASRLLRQVAKVRKQEELTFNANECLTRLEFGRLNDWDSLDCYWAAL